MTPESDIRVSIVDDFMGYGVGYKAAVCRSTKTGQVSVFSDPLRALYDGMTPEERSIYSTGQDPWLTLLFTMSDRQEINKDDLCISGDVAVHAHE
jgi:hypothetical protein